MDEYRKQNAHTHTGKWAKFWLKRITEWSNEVHVSNEVTILPRSFRGKLLGLLLVKSQVLIPVELLAQ